MTEKERTTIYGKREQEGKMERCVHYLKTGWPGRETGTLLPGYASLKPDCLVQGSVQ